MARQEIEIDEALGAVEDALGCLDAAARDLKSAGNWGWFDLSLIHISEPTRHGA